MAFPCNQFGGQEPCPPSEIKDFAASKGVPVDDPDRGFLMMEKVDVNGENVHPVYAFLKGATPDGADIKWNFGSYFLADPEGRVQRLEGLKNSPLIFADKVKAALAGREL